MAPFARSLTFGRRFEAESQEQRDVHDNDEEEGVGVSGSVLVREGLITSASLLLRSVKSAPKRGGLCRSEDPGTLEDAAADSRYRRPRCARPVAARSWRNR